MEKKGGGGERGGRKVEIPPAEREGYSLLSLSLSVRGGGGISCPPSLMPTAGPTP
jgi:hypothetical protein